MLRNRIASAALWACSLSGLLSGCSNEPLDISCPALSAGDLVVTEVRGPQTGNDQYGEWIEIYNTTGQTIDLGGLAVRLTKLDGSSEMEFIVRRPLSLPAGAFGVFGRQEAGAEPSHVDYGYVSDMDSKLFDSAAVRLRSCDTQIDLAVYRNLPTKGSLALNNAIFPPEASADEKQSNWCVDKRADADSPLRGIRGTPGAENLVCE